MTTYWVATDGDDANDGLSSGAPKLTIQAAVDLVTADNGDIVNVKTGTYGETVTIDTGTASGSGTKMTVLRGYTSSPGDGTDETSCPVTIDGAASRTTCVTTSGTPNYWIFEGIEATDSTGNAWDCGNLDRATWRHCAVSSAGSDGFSIGANSQLVRCRAINSTGANFTQSNTTSHYGILYQRCVSIGGTHGFRQLSGVAVVDSCVAASASTIAIEMKDQVIGTGYLIVSHCLIDGDGEDTNTGIMFDNCVGPVVVMNNVIYDCATGIDCVTTDLSGFGIHTHNLLYGNTTNYGTTYDAVDVSGNDVTTEPLFADEASNDYRPVAGSGVINAAYGFTATSTVDIGPYEFKGGNRIKITPAAMAGGMT